MFKFPVIKKGNFAYAYGADRINKNLLYNSPVQNKIVGRRNSKSSSSSPEKNSILVDVA